MKQIKITAIGEHAVSEHEPILVLFNHTATDEIKKVAIINEELDVKTSFEIKTGSSISFGDVKYTVEKVGRLVNQSLKEMGHATIIFNQLSEEHDLPNSIYVTPTILPKLETGMFITFREEG